VADALEKKLGHKSPVVKFKALRVIKHLCAKGCSTFQRCMQRHSGAVRCVIHEVAVVAAVGRLQSVPPQKKANKLQLAPTPTPPPHPPHTHTSTVSWSTTAVSRTRSRGTSPTRACASLQRRCWR